MSELNPEQSPVAPVAPAVQPEEPKAVHAYREIQSERDAAVAKASTLEEYEKLTPRLQEQVEKQKKTILQFEAKDKVSKLLETNPYLKPLAALQDFTGKSDEDINAWGKAATDTLNSMKGNATTPLEPTSPSAPGVQPVTATAADGQMITPEALKLMPVAEQRAYLIAHGIIKS